MERRIKFILLTLGIILLLIGLLGYAYYQSRGFLTGPLLTIETPENGAISSIPLITIKGTARNVSFLLLNGRQIFTNQAGNFNEQLLLPSGYSIMTLVGTDRFGHRAEKRLELIYRQRESAQSIVL